METIRYEDAAIDERIIRAVTEIGYEEMTPIQQMAIPALLEGQDIIGQAQTGTGKTAAFGIPLVQRIDPENENVQAIVLCPTRELAIQAAEELRRFSKYMPGVKILPVYGGQDIEKQIRSLKSKVSIIVGTPGRVMDHMRRHTLKLDDVRMVVLDEADEMLNMGFVEDMETILAQVPQDHQTALFSATMPQEILDITGKYQKDAQLLQVERKELTIPLVKQYYYEVQRQNKEEVVSRLLDYYNPKLSLIFCNTKHMVDTLTENLKGRGYFADGLHGDLSQAMRDKVMNSFRAGTTEILIATDVAARGLDVDNVEAVFNYDIPQDVEYYVHRIGRTGRAGKKGRSFTLVVGREIYRIREIERICHTQIKPRMVPSVADITQAKASQVFDQVLELIANNDLSALQKKVEDKLEEENLTAMELCAGFLKLHLGEDKEEIPAENYLEEQRRKRSKRGKDSDREHGRERRKKHHFEDEDIRDIFRDRKEKDRRKKKDRETDADYRKEKDHRREKERGTEANCRREKERRKDRAAEKEHGKKKDREKRSGKHGAEGYDLKRVKDIDPKTGMPRRWK